ncbi:hypothetical protein DFQ01_103328 [Paenibacillus cellulosilyticus]|uniref:YceG-like family protein n=1 Tax=Paenibacillus cellulosilyticus TaxID=375489 RepID=A0A2V2Z051_9BACL|nr:hypothetical protein [Paenibacillus cellulosilyticus]PWW06425.1 hypothetical protein DFQ01_103328 [Paenibacillus cellulosilyticus]QKS46229.1 hypothetical protein HUB94_18610 [Paenibacillus cellulosilyticus]
MFKDRRFLSGLGAGIVAGALLLQLMTMGQQSASLPDSEQSDQPMYSEQEVQEMIEKAKADAKAEADTNAAAGEQASTEGEQVKTPEAPEAPKQPEDAKAAVQPEQPSSPVADAAAEEEAQSTTVEKQVVIRIQPGANLTSTAKILSDNGLITSQSKFISKMKSDKKLVRAGYFAFKGEPTLDEVITTLTSKPLTESEANRIKSNS